MAQESDSEANSTTLVEATETSTTQLDPSTTPTDTSASMTTETTEPPAGCGDGEVVAPEVCDKGQENSQDNAYHEGSPEAAPCNSTCSGRVPYCGDMTCQPEHEDANTCYADCDPRCGNGVMEEGEPCDDGNLLDGDGCVDCVPAACGDGVVQMGVEGCDDGNTVATDSCTDKCQPAACGDGILWSGMEECDDENAANDDECSDACKLPRTVFVTKTAFLGNLGGLSGADAKCQAAAQAAGLGGVYKAWLSDGVMGPAQRLDTTFTGVYRLVDGSTVAVGWDDLTDGTLSQPIGLDEEGMSSEGSAVWSNSKPDGNSFGTAHCMTWVSMDAQIKGSTGNSSKMDDLWTKNEADPPPCNTSLRLYCFQNLQ